MTQPTERMFHLGDILSVTTLLLVSPRHISGVYDILNFMMGDDLYTHQFAAQACRPSLLDQLPQLKDVDSTEVTPENWKQWLDSQVALFGETLPVRPLKEWTPRDPIEQLTEMVGADRVIVVEAGR